MTTTIRAGAPISALDAPPAVSAWDFTQQANLSNTIEQPGSPDVTLTFTAPTSGRVMVIVGGGLRDNGGTNRVAIMPEIREDDSSGAIVENPALNVNAWSNASVNTASYQYGSRIIIAPLSAGGFNGPLDPGRTYFARVVQEVNGGTTADISNRDLTVIPMPFGHSYEGLSSNTTATLQPGTKIVRDHTTQLNVNGIDDPGSPEVSTSFIAPESGRVLAIVGGGIRDNSGGGNQLTMAFELRQDDRNGDDIFHIFAADAYEAWGWSNSATTTGTVYQYGNRASFLAGENSGGPLSINLIPRKRYFIRSLMSGGGGTCDVFNRDLFVIPLS